jgi:hypothetical protein
LQTNLVSTHTHTHDGVTTQVFFLSNSNNGEILYQANIQGSEGEPLLVINPRAPNTHVVTHESEYIMTHIIR